MSTEHTNAHGSASKRFPFQQAGYPHPMENVCDFADAYGLVGPLIPHDHRGDTFRDFRLVREFVDDLSDTLGSFTIRKLRRDTGLGAGNQLVIDYLIAIGSWRLKDRVYSGKERFSNPTYVHAHTLDHITDFDRRREYAEITAQFGFTSWQQLATAWGVGSPKDALYALDGFVWDGAVRQGKKDTCRTIMLAAEWLDRPVVELVDDLGISRSTYNSWRRRYDLAGFADDVPPDPVDVYGIWPK